MVVSKFQKLIIDSNSETYPPWSQLLLLYMVQVFSMFRRFTLFSSTYKIKSTPKVGVIHCIKPYILTGHESNCPKHEGLPVIPPRKTRDSPRINFRKTNSSFTYSSLHCMSFILLVLAKEFKQVI